jgi:hypothetical protein
LVVVVEVIKQAAEEQNLVVAVVVVVAELLLEQPEHRVKEILVAMALRFQAAVGQNTLVEVEEEELEQLELTLRQLE